MHFSYFAYLNITIKHGGNLPGRTAFYQLIEKVVARLKNDNSIKGELWLTGEQAMKKLGISSKTTLFKIRDIGQIRFVYASLA